MISLVGKRLFCAALCVSLGVNLTVFLQNESMFLSTVSTLNITTCGPVLVLLGSRDQGLLVVEAADDRSLIVLVQVVHQPGHVAVVAEEGRAANTEILGLYPRDPVRLPLHATHYALAVDEGEVVRELDARHVYVLLLCPHWCPHKMTI